ncbi:hypothetical protein QZJ86_11045 [Methylomonas montana]|uniref:hypothetical protein n=1 Tax=Methylomonas montana TaxID=3058963 RepID=UPI00265A3AA8|nr:hypothetical protein [Methylomonas montana]WKJ88563.1 hypothetical protein QZJ86_11045 [Methylomonas montana]
MLIFLLLSTTVFAETNKAEIPLPLVNNVKKLSELLMDAHASVTIEPATIERIDLKPNQSTYLILFIVESYLGGNSWTQYLAAFDLVKGEDGKPDSYPLIDFIPIGGTGCRIVQKLNPNAATIRDNGEKVFRLDVLENTESDNPNHPTRTAQLDVFLKSGRFTHSNQLCYGPWH